jgi:hypothetical protein
MRVRSAGNRLPGLLANLRLAGLLAAAFWYGLAISAFLSSIKYPRVLPAGWTGMPLWAAAGGAGCLAIASAWFWRPRVTITVSLAAAAASALALHQAHDFGDLSFVLRQIGPALVLAALATGRNRLPRSWLSLPAAWLAISIIVMILDSTGNIGPEDLLSVAFWIILAVTVIWAVTDPRPVTAVGLALQATFLTALLHPGYGIDFGLIRNLVLVAAALGVTALRARRKTTA